MCLFHKGRRCAVERRLACKIRKGFAGKRVSACEVAVSSTFQDCEGKCWACRKKQGRNWRSSPGLPKTLCAEAQDKTGQG